MANKWTVLTESETSVSVASGTLTLDLPVFGAGGATVKAGTKTGNTDEVVTATGAPAANRPLLFDANGNAVARQPRGNTTVVQLADSITNPTSGNVAGFDANGNVKDSGLAAASLLVNPLTTKGDLIGYGTGVARLAVGTDGQVLTARSTATDGVDWETPAIGGGVNVQSGNYTAVSGDNGKLISFSGPATLTLPVTPVSSTWNIWVENIASATVTVATAGGSYPSGYTPRETGAAFGALETFDRAAATAMTYSATVTATTSTNLFATLTALKPSGASVPAFVQGNWSGTPGTSSGLATYSCAYTSPNTAGNCLVMDIETTIASGPIATLAVTDTQGNTWTLASGGYVTGGSGYWWTYIAPNCAVGANTVTVVPSVGTFSDLIMAVHEYSGVATSSSVDAQGSSASYTASTRTVSVTTTGANRLLHLFGATRGNYLSFGPTIDGVLTAVSLATNQGMYIATDGTNYFTERGAASAGGGGGTVPTATTSVFGIVKPDGTTIDVSSGVISVPIATTSLLGLVKPDGTTILDTAGAISVPTATTSAPGLVKPDNSTVTISSGVLSVPTATPSALGLVRPDGTTVTIASGVISASATVTATSSTLGVVKPDNSTVNIASGVLSVPTATTSLLGLVKPDGTSITISGGVISSVSGSSSATHSEPLTDGQGNLIFANGDVVMVSGVPN